MGVSMLDGLSSSSRKKRGGPMATPASVVTNRLQPSINYKCVHRWSAWTRHDLIPISQVGCVPLGRKWVRSFCFRSSPSSLKRYRLIQSRGSVPRVL